MRGELVFVFIVCLTGLRRPVGCLIFIGHFPPKSPINGCSLAGNGVYLFFHCVSEFHFFMWFPEMGDSIGIYIYMCVHMYVYICTCTCVYVSIYIHVNIYICVHVYVYIFIYINIYVCTHVCVHMYIYQ